ncbi:MAG: hypothetical protein K1X53_15640 [Candidatus Sumerlaeaceae bacterium]|nr:hypothetical protein [Candidatus Sumerlaeaceae bacterium]
MDAPETPSPAAMPAATKPSWRERMELLRPEVEKRYRLLVVLMCLLLSLGIHLPALGNKYFLFGTDTIAHDYIMHMYGWQSITGSGLLPLWCPYLFCGFPFLASFALCPFYPSQWLYLLVPFNTAFTLQYVLAVALAGILTTWWLRQIPLRRGVALWGGIAAMFSGHFLTLTYAGHLQKMIAIAWAPLAFGAALQLCRMARQRGEHPGLSVGSAQRPVLLFALALGMQLLASHSQIFYATLSVCGAQALIVAVPLLVKAWVAPDHGLLAPLRTPPARAVAWLVLRYGLVLFLGIGLSAVQMFPGWEMAGVSNRAHGVSFEEATETSYPPAEILEYGISRVFGDSVRDTPTPYFGSWGERIVSDYLGAPLLVLALVGLAISRRRYRWFLGGLVLASIVVGLGFYTPLYKMLYASLPGFRSFRSPGTFMFLANFGLLALAAMGLEAIQDSMGARAEGSPNTRSKRFGTVVGMTAMVLLGAGLAMICVGIYRNWGVRLAIATAAEKQRYHIFSSLMGGGVELALAAGLLRVGIVRFVSIEGWPAKLPRWSLTALVFLALGLPLIRNYHFVSFDSLERFSDYLRFQPVYATLQGLGTKPVRLLEQKDLKNDCVLHGIGTPTGYHPVLLERYRKMLSAVGFETELFGDMVAIGFAHRYSNQPPVGVWKLLRQTTNESIYQWNGSPRLYAKPRATIRGVGSEEDVLNALGRASVPTGEFAAVKSDLEKAGVKSGPQRNSAELQEWRPGYVRLKTDGSAPSLLPLAEPIAPGWNAVTDDGRTLAQLPVNYGMRAVVLPGEASTVTLRYEPFSFRFGLFVSMLVTATTLIIVIARSHRILMKTRVGAIIAGYFHGAGAHQAGNAGVEA